MLDNTGVLQFVILVCRQHYKKLDWQMACTHDNMDCWNIHWLNFMQLTGQHSTLYLSFPASSQRPLPPLQIHISLYTWTKMDQIVHLPQIKSVTEWYSVLVVYHSCEIRGMSCDDYDPSMSSLFTSKLSVLHSSYFFVLSLRPKLRLS